MLNVKQGNCEYQFQSHWFDPTWNQTQVYSSTDKRSIPLGHLSCQVNSGPNTFTTRTAYFNYLYVRHYLKAIIFISLCDVITLFPKDYPNLIETKRKCKQVLQWKTHNFMTKNSRILRTRHTINKLFFSHTTQDALDYGTKRNNF